MAIYTYRAVDSRGRRICGHREVPTVNEIKQYLERKGLKDYKIFESQTLFSNSPYKHIKPEELSVFCYMASLLTEPKHGGADRTGTLITGLNMLSVQSDNDQLKLALKEICGIMEQGLSLAEAMGMYGHLFTNYTLNMVNIGETTGTLHESFKRLSAYFEKEGAVRDKLKAAIIYPSILAAVTAFVLIAIVFFILPSFDSLLKSAEGTLTIAASFTFAKTVSLTLLIFLSIVATAAAIAVYWGKKAGKSFIDKLKIKTPVVRYIFTRASAVRVARSAAVLTGKGVQAVNALDEVRPVVQNKYVEERLSTAMKNYRSNGDAEQVFECLRIFPPVFLNMFSLGIAVGHLSETLDKLADILEAELDAGIDKLLLILEPALTIILSIIIGAVLISVMLPLASIMTL